jgi:DNA-binding transcriptional LysR family regulator
MTTSHSFLNISWDEVRLFLATAQEGSFSAAARLTGLGQATLSRRVAALEKQVGHALFERTRDGVALTEAARRLLPWAEAMGASMREAGASVAGLEAKPEGRVRLTCSPGMGFFFAPVLARRLALSHPKIVLEVLAEVRVRDLAAHEADVALRTSLPPTGPLLSKKLLEVPLGLYAAKTLVRRLAKKPRLVDVPLIDWSDEMPSLAGRMKVFPNPRVLLTNEFLSMMAAAEAGIGAVVCSAIDARQQGLVPVPVALPALPSQSVYLVTHQALRRVPRVQVVVQAIEAVAASLQEVG